MSTVADRVSAGIKLLDENAEGWRDKINVSALDIRSSFDCVLGQAFGRGDGSWESGYSIGREVLNLHGCACCPKEGGLSPYDYGFDANPGDEMDLDEQFELLQEEWERQLSLISA